MQTSEEQLHELSVLIKTLHALMTVGFRLKGHRYADLTKNEVVYFFEPPTTLDALSVSPEQLLDQIPLLLASDIHKTLLAKEILTKIATHSFPFENEQTSELAKKTQELEIAKDALVQLGALAQCLISAPIKNEQETLQGIYDYCKRQDANPKLKDVATKAIEENSARLLEAIKACQEGTIIQDYLQWHAQNKSMSRNCALVLANIGQIFLPALNEEHKPLIHLPSLQNSQAFYPKSFCLLAPDSYKVHAIWKALSNTNDTQALLSTSYDYVHLPSQKNNVNLFVLPDEILLDLFKYLLPNGADARSLEHYQKFSNIRLLCKQALNIYDTYDLWKFQFQRVISDQSGYVYEKTDQATQLNHHPLVKGNFKTLLKNELIRQFASPYYHTVKTHRDNAYFTLEAARRYVANYPIMMENIKTILEGILASITLGNLSAWFHLRKLAKECYKQQDLAHFFNERFGEFLQKRYQITSNNRDQNLQEILNHCYDALCQNLPKPDQDKIQKNLLPHFHMWQELFVTRNFNVVRQLFITLCLKYNNVCLSTSCLDFLISNPSGSDNLINNLTFDELNSYNEVRDYFQFKILSHATNPSDFKLIYSRAQFHAHHFRDAGIDFPTLCKVMTFEENILITLINTIKNLDANTKKTIITFLYNEPLYLRFLANLRPFVSMPLDPTTFTKFKLWSLKVSKPVCDLYADSSDCVQKICIDDFIHLLFDKPMQDYLSENLIPKKLFHSIGYLKTEQIMNMPGIPFDSGFFQKCQPETLAVIKKYKLYEYDLLWKSLLDFASLSLPSANQLIHLYTMKLALLAIHPQRSAFLRNNLGLLKSIPYRFLNQILTNRSLEERLQKLPNSEIKILYQFTLERWQFLSANTILLECLNPSQIASIPSNFITAAKKKPLFNKEWKPHQIISLFTHAAFEPFTKLPISSQILPFIPSIEQLISIIRSPLLGLLIHCPYWELFCEKWGMSALLQKENRDIELTTPFWCHKDNQHSDRSVYLLDAFLSAGSRQFWQAMLSNCHSISHIATQLNSDTLLQSLLSARPSILDTVLSQISLQQLAALNNTAFFQQHDLLTKFLHLTDEQLKETLSLFSFDDLLRISTTEDEQAVLLCALTFPNEKYAELNKKEQLTTLKQLLNSNGMGLLKLSDCIMSHPPTIKFIAHLLATFKKDIVTTLSLLNINDTLLFILDKLSHIDSQILVNGCTSIEEVANKLNKLNALSIQSDFAHLFDPKYPELAKLILASNLSICDDNQLIELLLSYPQHPLFKVVTYEQLLKFHALKVNQTKTKSLLEFLLLPETAEEFNTLAHLHWDICDYILKNSLKVSAVMYAASAKGQASTNVLANPLSFFAMKRPPGNDDNGNSKRPRYDDDSNKPGSKR